MLIEECCMREYTEQELVRRQKARKLREKNSFKHAKNFCPADDKSFLLRHSKSRKIYFSEKTGKYS